MVTTTLLVVGVPILLIGIVRWLTYPLAILFECRTPVDPAFSSPVPKVSVIVPAYNEQVLLAGCVQSILDSGYRRLELILVDDGSTDATLEVMRTFEPDPRVTIVAKPNGGKGSALNAGIERASGEVLVFVDADSSARTRSRGCSRASGTRASAPCAATTSRSTSTGPRRGCSP